MNRLDRSATNLEWQETSGMNYLFGKVNLEVSYDFSAMLAPASERRKSCVFKQLAAFV